MRTILLILLLSSPVFGQIDRVASALEQIASNQRTERVERLNEDALRLGVQNMQFQQLQAYAIQLERQNFVMQKELNETRMKLDTNQKWLDALLRAVVAKDTTLVSDKLSDLAKQYTRRRVDMDVKIKAN